MCGLFLCTVFQSNSSEFHDVAEPESQTDFDGCVKPGISLSTSSAMLSVLLDSPVVVTSFVQLAIIVTRV